jgi:hypothetical protein
LQVGACEPVHVWDAEDGNALEPLFGRFTIDDAILKSCTD